MVEVPLSIASTIFGCVEEKRWFAGDNGVVWKTIRVEGFGSMEEDE